MTSSIVTGITAEFIDSKDGTKDTVCIDISTSGGDTSATPDGRVRVEQFPNNRREAEKRWRFWKSRMGKPTDLPKTFGFSVAFEALKDGRCVGRMQWGEGKIWLKYMRTPWRPGADSEIFYCNGLKELTKMYSLCSDDLLADDWYIIEGAAE